MSVASNPACFVCEREIALGRDGFAPFELLEGSTTIDCWCSEECLNVSFPARGGPCCLACGMSLTPTPEQLRALERFGNPLRRPPCLETESGLHVIPKVPIPESTTRKEP